MSVITATLSFDKNGFGKTHMPVPRMFLEAIMAGFYIAVAGVASTIGASTVFLLKYNLLFATAIKL